MFPKKLNGLFGSIAWNVGHGRVFNLTCDPIPLSQDSCRLVFKLYDGLRMAENGYERGLLKRA